jgi:hypothetical protein
VANSLVQKKREDIFGSIRPNMAGSASDDWNIDACLFLGANGFPTAA